MPPREVPTFVKAMAVKRALAGMVDSSLLRFRGTDMCLSGLTIVRTGTPATYDDKELPKFVESYGGSLPGSVSGRTSYVLKAAGFGESKINKAKSLGTEIITEAHFYNIVLQRSIAALLKGNKLKDLGLTAYKKDLEDLREKIKKQPEGILEHDPELGRVLPKTLNEYVSTYGPIISLFLSNKEDAYIKVEDNVKAFLKDMKSGTFDDIVPEENNEETEEAGDTEIKSENSGSSLIPKAYTKPIIAFLHNAVEGENGNLIPRGTKTCLSGKTIVRSGTLNLFTSEEGFENYIKSLGGTVQNVVNNDTDILIKGIVKATKLGAIKEKKAKELGKEVMSESEFYDYILSESINELIEENNPKYKITSDVSDSLMELLQIIEDGVVICESENGNDMPKVNVPYEAYYKKFGFWGLLIMISEKEFADMNSKSIKNLCEICTGKVKVSSKTPNNKKKDNKYITDLEDEEKSNAEEEVVAGDSIVTNLLKIETPK